MQSYDEVTSKFSKYLSSGQKKLLQKRANALSMQNSVARQNVVTDAYKGLKAQNEYLSAMGLAANLQSAPSSGADEVARRMPEMRQELRKLDAAEQGALTPVGAQMAQETINAQLAAQRQDNGMYRISDGNGGFVKNADGTDMWVSKKDKYSIEHGGKVTDANRYSHDRVKGYQLAAPSLKGRSVFEVSNKFTAAGQQPSVLQDLKAKLATAPKDNMTNAVAAAANRSETNSIIKAKLGNVAGNFTNAINKVFGTVLNKTQENDVAQAAGIQNIISSFSNNGIITQQAADALAKSVANGSVNLDDVKQQLFERLTIDFGIKTENSANAAMGNVSGGFVSTAAQQVIDSFMIAAESGKTADYDNVVNLYCDYIKEQSDANLQLFDEMLAQYYKAGMQRPELDAARAAFKSGETELAYSYLNNFENMTQAEAILQAVNAAAGVPSGDPNVTYFHAGEPVITQEQAEDIRNLVEQGRFDEAIDVFNTDAEAYYVKRSDELWSERHEDIHQFYTMPVDEANLDEFYMKNPLVFELDKLYTLAKSAQTPEAWDMYGVAYKNLYNHKADQDRLEAQYGVDILEKVYGMSEDDSAKVMAAWDRMYNEGDFATYEQALANASFAGGIIGYEALMLRNAQLASIGVRFQDYYKYDGMTDEQIQHMIDVLEPVKTEPHPKPEMTGDPLVDAAALTQWQIEENAPERQGSALKTELENVLRVRRIDERTEDLERLRALDDAALAEYETGLTDRMSKTLTELDPYATGTQYNADKMSPQRLRVIGSMLTGAEKLEFDDVVDEWLLVGSVKTERGQVAKAKHHEELISGIQANEDYVQWSTYGKNRLYTKEDIVEQEYTPTGDPLIDAAAKTMNLVEFHEAQRYDTVFDVQAALQLSDEEFYEQYTLPNEIGGSGRTQFDVYRYMNDEEKGCFYYKLHESPKAAYEFLEEIKPYCTERQTRENQKVATEAAKSHPFLSHLITYATSVPANYSSLINIAKDVVDGEHDPYSEWNTLSVWNSTVRETHYADVATWLTNHDEEELVGITNFVMGGIDSWIDSLINAQFTGGIMKVSSLGMTEKAANFVGEAAGLVGFGANAYTTTLRDLDEKGINIEDSRKVATAAAFFEMFFEKIGLENILNGSKDWAKSGIALTVKSALIEASEEGNTTWGNITADSIILGNQSHWADDYNAFRDQGHSVAASGALASLESVKSIGIDAAGGGFSGGLSGIVNSARMHIQQKATGAAINAAGRATAVMDAAQNAVDNGTATPALQKLMHTVAEAYAKSNTISNTDLGKLNYLLAVSDMEQADGAIDKLEDEGALTSKEAAAARDAFEQAYDSVSRLEDSAVYGFNQQQIDEMFADFSEEKRKLIFKSVNENTKGRAQYHAGMNEQRIKQLAESRVGEDITGDERKKAVADEVEAIKREQEWQRVERAKKAVGYQSVEVDDNIVNSMPTIATENYDGVEVRLHKYQNTEQMGYMNKLRLDFVRAMSKASGVSVVVHDTLPVNGALESNGVMHISLDAQGVGSAIGHELTHFIRQNVTGDEWQNFVKFIKETADKRDKHGFERLAERNMQKYAKVMENLTEAQKTALVEEETICGLCEDVLKDDVRMQEFFEESPTLFGKVCAWLDRVVKHFKEIVGDKSYNARLMQHDIEELRDRWFAAFKVATKNAADKKVQKAAETGYAEEVGGIWMYSMKDDEYMQLAETYVRSTEEAEHYRQLADELGAGSNDIEAEKLREKALILEHNAETSKESLERNAREAAEERVHKWDVYHGTSERLDDSTQNMNFSLKDDLGGSEQYKLDVDRYNSALKTWALLQDTLKEAEANGDIGAEVQAQAAITRQLDELAKYVIDAGERRGYTQLVFHGTSAAFDAFSPDYEKFGLFGKGVYTTESEDVANSYQTKEKGSNNRTLKMLARIGNEIDMDAAATVSLRETLQAMVDNVDEVIEKTLADDDDGLLDKEGYKKISIADDAEHLVEPIGEYEDALITEMPIDYDDSVFSRDTHEKVCELFKNMNKAAYGDNEVPEALKSYNLYLQAARGILKQRGSSSTELLRELGWMVELRKLAALGDTQSAIEYEQRKQKYKTEYKSRFSNNSRVWQLSDADVDFWEHILDTGKTFNEVARKAREAAYAKYKELYGFKDYGYDSKLELLEHMMDTAEHGGGIKTNEDVYDIVMQLLNRSNQTGMRNGKPRYATSGKYKDLINLSNDSGTILKAAWSRMGYSGITHTGGLRMGNGNTHKVHIFFNAQQDLKYADPITYYKNGNPIKLDKRFDDTKTGDETLKFSLKDSDFERRDNDFLEAFRAGNKVLLHKINTEAAIAAGAWSRDGQTPTVVYHGSNSFGFHQWDENMAEIISGYRHAYVTEDLEVAMDYLPDKGNKFVRNPTEIPQEIPKTMEGVLAALRYEFGADYTLDEGTTYEQAKRILSKKMQQGIYQFYVFPKNAVGCGALEIDAKGRSWERVPYTYHDYDDDMDHTEYNTTDELAFAMFERGYTAVHFVNVDDGANKLSSEWCLDSPNTQLKYAYDVVFDDNGDPIPPSKRYNLKEKAWMYSLKEDRETKKDAPKLFSKTWFAKVKKFQTLYEGDNMQYFSVKGKDFKGDGCTYVGNQYMIAKVKGDYDIAGEFNGTSMSKNSRAFDDLFKNASDAQNAGDNFAAEDIPSVKELDAFIKRAKAEDLEESLFRLDSKNRFGEVLRSAFIDPKALKAALEVVGDKDCYLFIEDAIHPVYFTSADGSVEALVCPVRAYEGNTNDFRQKLFNKIYDNYDEDLEAIKEEKKEEERKRKEAAKKQKEIEELSKKMFAAAEKTMAESRKAAAETAVEEDENARKMKEFEEQQKREAEKDAARKAIRERAEAEVEGKYKYFFTGDLESDIDNVMLITGKDRERLWKEAENTAESVYGKEIPEGKVENIFSNNLRHANERNVESLEEKASTLNPEDSEDAESLYYVYKELAEVNAKKALLSKLADAIEKIVPVSGDIPEAAPVETVETAPVETETEPASIPETETNEQVPVTESTEIKEDSTEIKEESTETSKEDQKKANAKWRKEAMQDFRNEQKKEADAIAAEDAEERAAIQEAEGVTPEDIAAYEAAEKKAAADRKAAEKKVEKLRKEKGKLVTRDGILMTPEQAANYDREKAEAKKKLGEQRRKEAYATHLENEAFRTQREELAKSGIILMTPEEAAERDRINAERETTLDRLDAERDAAQFADEWEERTADTVTEDSDAAEKAWEDYIKATYGGLYKTKEEAYAAMTADLKKQQEEEDKYAAEVRAARFHVHDGTRTAPHITEQIQGMDDTPVLYEAQRITEKTPDENGEVNLIPKVIRDIVKAAKASSFLGLKDYSRVMDKVSGKNREIREALSTILEKPFLEAGYRYTHNLPAVRANYMDSMKELGITGENYERYSAAMQHYGEGYIVVDGEKVDYTLNDLKKDCPENWQQVKKAAEITRDLYDDYVDRINTMLEGIYPDVIEHAYTDKKRLDALVEEEDNKAKAYRERAGVVYQQLEKAKARAAKAKHGTDAWAKANAAVAMYERRLDNVKLIAAKHEGRAAVRRAQAQQITQALATGDEIRNKRLIRRADYMHHTMKEESQGFIERVKNAWTGTAGEIPPELVSKTDMTKPKTGHAKFMDKRRGIDSKADAVGSMLSYIEQAERKLAYDPFIAHLSYVERLVEEAAQDEYEATGAVNANDFKRFIHEWRNDIAGKSNPIDRAFSDSNILPRNLYETLQTLGGRANANAVLFNFGSAAVQASNLVNAATYVTNVKDWLSGAFMFARMEYSDAADAQQLREIYQQSTFMTQRYGMELQGDPRNNDSKLKKFATAMMGALDELAGKWMWFSAYNQYNEKRAADVGHTYTNAIEYADDITRRSVAGRGIGERPFTLTSKFVNTAAPFQLEIANTMQNLGEQFGKKNIKGLTLFALTTYAMNLGFKALFGTKKLPWDVVDMLISAVTDGFDDDDDEEEVGVGTKALRTGRNILQGTGGMFLESIPFNSVVLGQLSQNATGILGDYAPETFGSSSLGYGTLLDTAVSAGKLAAHGLNGNWSNFDVFWTDFLENSDWLKMVLPYGGTQAQRSLKGIDAAVRGYSQKLNSDGELEAQFAVNGFFDALRSATLGKWATAGGRAYLAGETKKLTAEETAELKASDLPAKDFFTALQALKDAKKTTKNAYGETVVTSSANQYAAIRDAKPELQMTMLNRMGEKAAGAALKAVDNGVDLNTWLDYMVDYGTHDPEADEGRNAEIRHRLVADVASGKLTQEQAAYMDAAITGAKTVHDYASPEWYELSGNESHYNMAKWANSQGIDPTLALTWYNNKSVKTLDEYGNEKSIPQEEILKDLQRNVAQGTLTEEQAAILETMLYPDKKNKRDFSSEAAFEISASDSNYAYYKASGLDADMALRWYNFKAEKSPDAAGVMHSRKKEEVEDALAQATDMTVAQKEAAHRMMYPDGSKVPDYRSYTWYKIYKSGDSNYKKALFAVRDGAPVEAALKEIEAYNAAKAAGKTWKAKDTKAFCYSLGLPKGQADALYYAMSGKTKN